MQTRQDLFCELEIKFRRLLRTHRKNMAELLGDDLTPSEFMFLQHLGDAGASKMSDLALVFRVNLSHVTSVIDKLHGRGLVNRVRSTTDRRVVEIKITDEGLRLIESMKSKREDYFHARFQNLSDKDITEMIHFLSELQRSY